MEAFFDITLPTDWSQLINELLSKNRPAYDVGIRCLTKVGAARHPKSCLYPPNETEALAEPVAVALVVDRLSEAANIFHAF